MPAERSYGVLVSVSATLTGGSNDRLLYIGGYPDKWTLETVGTDTVFELKEDLSDWEERTELKLKARSYAHGAFIYT